MAQSLVLSSLKEAIKTERPPSLTGSNTDSQNLRIYNTYMIKMNQKQKLLLTAICVLLFILLSSGNIISLRSLFVTPKTGSTNNGQFEDEKMDVNG